MGKIASLLCILGAAIMNVGSSLSLKFSSRREGLLKYALFALGLGFGALNVPLYASSLKRIPLGVAYPLLASASIILITLASALVFKERITIRSVAGITVIIAGIFIIAD
jgi:multidrug transporter EmrE-like cation transporter